jgi:AraC-like DNA-binding protein
MMRLIFLAAVVCFCGLPASAQDTSVAVIKGGSVSYLSWASPRCSPSSFKSVREEAAIIGSRGFFFDTEGGCGYSCQAPFMADAWARFYLRLNTVGPGTADPRASDSIHFLSYHYSVRLNREQPKSFVSFHIVRNSGSGRFMLDVNLRPSSDSTLTRQARVPFSADTLHCVETRVNFRAADSVDFSLFLDGDSVYGISTAYYFRKDFQYLMLWGLGGLRVPWRLWFDEFTLSDKRLFTLPMAPSGCGENISEKGTDIFCAPFSSSYRNESLAATHWKVYQADRPRFPVFDAVETDPIFQSHRPIPFPLDSGEYFWQVSFKNNFGYWSSFSAPRGFKAPPRRDVPIRLHEAFLAKRGTRRPVHSLIKERPVDLVVRISPKRGWADVGYIMALIRHVSFTLGHPGNYGGYCDPERSYIINLSFDEMGPSGPIPTLYEKFLPKAVPVKVVLNGEPSRFIIGIGPDAVSLDTLTGEIRLSLRLLKEALEGPWEMTTFVFDSYESFSNMVHFPFTVKTGALSRIKGRYMGIAALFLLLALVALIRFVRRPMAPRQPDQAYLRLLEYLSARLTEDLNFERVRKDLKYSVHQLHKVLKRNGAASLPRLLNDLRISRAKELLADTVKNISEVGFEVGFSEARYFTKVFKDYTGMTPSEFREKTVI